MILFCLRCLKAMPHLAHSASTIHPEYRCMVCDLKVGWWFIPRATDPVVN